VFSVWGSWFDRLFLEVYGLGGWGFGSGLTAQEVDRLSGIKDAGFGVWRSLSSGSWFWGLDFGVWLQTPKLGRLSSNVSQAFSDNEKASQVLKLPEA